MNCNKAMKIPQHNPPCMGGRQRQTFSDPPGSRVSCMQGVRVWSQCALWLLAHITRDVFAFMQQESTWAVLLSPKFHKNNYGEEGKKGESPHCSLDWFAPTGATRGDHTRAHTPCVHVWDTAPKPPSLKQLRTSQEFLELQQGSELTPGISTLLLTNFMFVFIFLL